jgi:hypothetical protein
MDQPANKPKLVFFQFQYDDRLPAFLLTHKQEHVKCLAQFFDVKVISENCDYRRVCDTYEPDLALFESGVNHETCRRLEISGTNSNPNVPKLGLHHADGFCNARAGFLSDMDLWGIDTFFSIATTTAEHTPEMADKLFAWPVFIDPDIYHDYRQWKSIPVLFTGNRNQFYPWRQDILKVVSEHYPSMICPHPGYEPRSTAGCLLIGEEYARTLSAAWFVPACGTVAKQVVRKHFEIPATKACLIAEDSPSLRMAGFADMKNCVFADARTIVEKLECLFQNPATLEGIISAGHDLVHSRHTIRHRDQIFQWYSLYKQLSPGQKIIQRNPFGPLVAVEEASGQRTVHIMSGGTHLDLLREGDDHLWRGRYDEAERCYLKCLGYMRWLPEAKFRLTLCNLFRGAAASAMSWLKEPLHFVLDTYGASDPDPVEWAYFLISLLCLGKVSAAKRYAAEFPGLNHPELDRARWAIAVLAHGDGTVPVLVAANGRRRRTLHQLPDRTFEEWVSQLCTMLTASGQSGMAAEILACGSRKPSFNFGEPTAVGARNTAASSPRGRYRVALPLRKQVFWGRLRDGVKRVVGRPLHRLEAKYGYFLPYPLSEARKDSFFGVLQSVTREDQINTVVVIGATPGKYSTEALLAGAVENRRKPRVFCISRSNSLPITGRNRSTHNDAVRWYPLSRTAGRTSATLEETVKMVLDQVQNDGIDIVAVNISELREHAAPACALPCLRRAGVIILEHLNSSPAYKAYGELRADPSYVLTCYNPSVHGGYAVFKKASPREEPGDSEHAAVPFSFPVDNGGIAIKQPEISGA